MTHDTTARTGQQAGGDHKTGQPTGSANTSSRTGTSTNRGSARDTGSTAGKKGGSQSMDYTTKDSSIGSGQNAGQMGMDDQSN